MLFFCCSINGQKSWIRQTHLSSGQEEDFEPFTLPRVRGEIKVIFIEKFPVASFVAGIIPEDPL